MVSRILASLSGMLLGSEGPSTFAENEHMDVKNDNEQKSSATATDTEEISLPSLQRECSLESSNMDLHFVNAEQLDRAIVNRLRSRMSNSVADVLEQPNSTTSRIKLRCEENAPNVTISKVETDNEKNCEETQKGDTAPMIMEKESMLLALANPEWERGISLSEIRHLQSASRLKTSLSHSSMMSHDIPSIHSNATSSFKNFVGEINDGKPIENIRAEDLTTSSGENRSVMYRNSQFNLDNSSKEALCSNSSRLLPDTTTHSDNLLHLPVFGIPDPTMLYRQSLTSSTQTIPGGEESTNRRQPPVTPKISGTQIGHNLLEDTISQIIEKEGEDFKSKYSSWIWDAFRAQLLKLKSIMLDEFNEKLSKAISEREHEVLELQRRYRQKLSEFDSTSEHFQKMMDNTYRDNQRMLTAKDFVIDKLKKEFLECKKHFEQDLQRQMQSYRTEAEMERMALQKRNDELMLVMLTDESKCGIEQVFKNEIESLQQMVQGLKNQNEELNQQLQEGASSILNRSTGDPLESQLNQAAAEIMELRKKLEFSENQKQDLSVTYHQEIAKLNRKIQESNTRYDHQLRDAAEEMESLRKKHIRDTRELRQKMISQETEHNAIISQLRHQYGSQVETLSLAVSKLRAELSGANGSGIRHSH